MRNLSTLLKVVTLLLTIINLMFLVVLYHKLQRVDEISTSNSYSIDKVSFKMEDIEDQVVLLDEMKSDIRKLDKRLDKTEEKIKN